MFNHKLPSDFPMQTLRKKSSPCKYKNEPGRFLGEGVSFRAKLIGVLEVPEARGDRMCQEALADLKMAIRAAGEHKQRIQVHVAIDGLRLRDDKTGDSLYHHPVHKISFIAQDMTDSRAFGYIFGAPDTGHRFFGIKTDKAASQVVIAMRDLFQVVFELKKKEVEMAKQNLEGKPTSSLVRHITTSSEAKAKIPITSEASTSKPPESEGVAELVDLEQELSSLRRGLTQVEGLTPSTDPFGDSFIVSSQKGLLPPPPTARTRPARTSSPQKPALFDLAAVAADFEPQPAPLDTLPEPELKNPPKKVLKDLVPATQMLTDLVPTEPKSDSYGPTTIMTSLSRQSGGTVAIAKPAGTYSGFFSSDPFAETDPFDNTDPFSDTFKDDPFTSMQEFPKLSSLRTEELKSKLSSLTLDKPESGENAFNGPLQVTLPPEPVPKSPRLQRQATDSSTIRQRPQPISKADNASPPPPLPPKKPADPPRRPPHDDDAPPLPKPVRKKEPYADRSMKPRAASLATSSEDEYLAPAPPPLPAARRLDITLSQLLTASVDELAARLRVPAATLSSMTLPQLTEYLRSYVAAENEKAHIHVDQPVRPEREKITPVPIAVPEKPAPAVRPAADFKPQFEDNFAPSHSNDTFVANFDDFDKKANPSYDKYAAFREIQEEELKSITIIEPDPPGKQDNEDNELASIERLIKAEEMKIELRKEQDKSPLKSLDELTMDTFNMFRNSISPKPIDEKIEDIKAVMKNLQIEKDRSSVSPRDNGVLERKDESDRYAALREITITEPPDEFESLPPEAPKERKKSDEKSDGFDNSDFFDCIDNSSLTFSHVEDAFRKSPVVVPEEKKEEKKSPEVPVRESPPARLSAGSVSDVASGSSPDTKGPVLSVGVGVGVGLTRLGWAEGWSSDSRDSEPRARRTRPQRGHAVQTSSSSRDVSPWDEEPMPRPAHHASRHNSSGSRECLDSGSGREKEKKRDKNKDVSRDGRESARDRRDSGSGRDRRDSKERDVKDHRETRERRDRRSRDRDKDTWSTDRNYSRERDYRDSRSRERHTKDYRDIERHRAPRRSYDDDDYSDGCGSGRSSPRDRWRDTRWRRDDRHYGSLGWRDSRRRNEMRQIEDSERRYGSTLAWPGRRSGGSSRRESDRDHRDSRDSGRDSRDARDSGRDSGRDSRGPRDVRDQRDSGRESRDASGRDSGRDARDSGRDSGRDSRDRESRDMRRRRRDERPRHRDYRFSNDFSPREREHATPFDNDFPEPPPPTTKKRAPYSSLEGTRFAFETEDTASPGSVNSPAARFRFDSDSLSPRSMFEDDFTVSTPRARTASIAEEDEDLPPLRAKPPQQHKDIKKSDSVNIFTRESDPFEGDSFFACTGSDRVARRENWPGDFKGFDNA